MEEGPEARVKIELKLHPEVALKREDQSAPIIQKGFRKSKKDALKEKKLLKLVEKKQPSSEELETEAVSTRNKEEELAICDLKHSEPKEAIQSKSTAENASTQLSKLIVKPSYINLVNGAKLVGNIGHGSALLKRPVLQGDYFMEFILRGDTKKDKKTTYPSAARLGICINNFDTAYPLGCQGSIGYKSRDGSIIYNNQCIGKTQPYSVGDVIGVCMRLAPPKKHSKPEEVNQGSTVEFYKNGRLVFEYSSLKQLFYCFGLSTFNYSQVEVCLNQEGVFKPHDSRHYFTSFKQPILYRDILNSKLFKI